MKFQRAIAMDRSERMSM